MFPCITCWGRCVGLSFHTISNAHRLEWARFNRQQIECLIRAICFLLENIECFWWAVWISHNSVWFFQAIFHNQFSIKCSRPIHNYKDRASLGKVKGTSGGFCDKFLSSSDKICKFDAWGKFGDSLESLSKVVISKGIIFMKSRENGILMRTRTLTGQKNVEYIDYSSFLCWQWTKECHRARSHTV